MMSMYTLVYWRRAAEVPGWLSVWYNSDVVVYCCVVWIECWKDELASSATVSDVTQNRSWELTQPMRRTRSMHRSWCGLDCSGGTTYINAPTSSDRE